MSRKPQFEVGLTQYALQNLREIRAYSTVRWGASVADAYLDDIESALSRIAMSERLLQTMPDLPADIKFYQINKHLLVCDLKAKSVVVLAVLHASMDLPRRLAELQPTLHAEVEMLHHQLAK